MQLYLLGQNALKKSDCWIFKSPVSPVHIDETVSFFACYQQSTKIKSWLKSFLLVMIKNGCGQWADGINWFACWYKFMQVNGWLKIFGVDIVKNGCGQSGGEALKLTIFEEWRDGINWFYACWYRFTKIKRWSRIFWMGMFTNGCSYSGQWNLKLAVSQKWIDGINRFCACWYKFRVGVVKDSMIFGWAWSKMAIAF